jgi:hypothetical protein
MLPAPTGLRSFLKIPRELDIFTLLYDVHYSIDPILNVLER